jgi:kynurenine formamidase
VTASSATDQTEPKLSNWGRWGDQDERGSANFVSGDDIRRAAHLVKNGVVFALGQPLDRNQPISHTRSPALHFMSRDGGDYAAGERLEGDFESADDSIVMACAGGTHVDSLAHFWYGGQLYNGHSGNSIRSSGAQRCGIEKLPSLVGRGVLLNFPAFRGVDHLAGAEPISGQDMQDCADAAGVTIERGDIVLVRTGWSQVYHQSVDTYYANAPGINLDAARWLVEHEVAAVGGDTTAIEVSTGKHRFEFGSHGPIAHRLLIRDAGTYMIELLHLEELGAAGATEFLFMMAPLRIVGGVNSPVNPLAIT